MRQSLQVFISSTLDLKKERKAVTEVLNQIRAIPVKMELFTARNNTPEQVCLDEVSSADIYIGIFAERYGYVPSDNNPDNLSVTAMEFKKAREKGIPTLVFIKETENIDKQLSIFLAEISSFNEGVYRKSFNTVGDLKYWLLASLVYYLLPKIDDDLKKNRLESLLPMETVYRHYLQNTCEYADFKGIHQLRRVIQIKLNEIYVPLQLAKLTELSEKIFENPDIRHEQLTEKLVNITTDKSSRKQGVSLIDDDASSILQKTFSLENGIAPNKKMVILGGLGSGKTTMLRQLTGKLVIDRSSNLFPILVPLRDYEKIKGKIENISILDYLTNYFSLHELQVSKRLFEKYLMSGGCVVMFDGLDEILVEQDRIEAATKIEEFAACFGLGNTIIVTSRIPSYRLVQLTGFEHYTVQQLDAIQVSEFVEKWFEHIEETETSENSQSLLSMLSASPNLQSLSTNPLMLSLICLISLQGIPIPKRSADLYDICIRTLSSSWEAKKGFSGVLSEPQRFEAIKKLAFSFLEQRKITATEYEVLLLLERILGEQQLCENDPKIESLQIFRAITERSGILVEREPNTYGFVHLGFRDYLASLYLAGTDNVKEIFTRYLNNRLHSLDYEQTICLCSRSLVQQSMSRATVFINEILSANSSYEDLAHCDLILSLKCLISSGMTEGIPASIVLKKLVDTLKKAKTDEGVLAIATLVEADFETIEKFIAEMLPELKPEIAVSFLEMLALKRKIPNHSNIIDQTLDYLTRHLSNPEFEFEISLIVLQFIRNKSKKATDFVVKYIEDGKESIAYPFSGLTPLLGYKVPYYREKIVRTFCPDDNCQIVLLAMVDHVDHELGKALAHFTIEKAAEATKSYQVAKHILDSTETRQQRRQNRLKQDEKDFDNILLAADYSAINNQGVRDLNRLELNEEKMVNSIQFLERMAKQNKQLLYALCRLYGQKLVQYPTLVKEITAYISEMQKIDSLESKLLLSYLAIDLPSVNMRKQKLLALASDSAESVNIRQDALRRLDKMDLTDEDLLKLFSFYQEKDIQGNLFFLLLRRQTFDREIVMRTIAQEIKKGNDSLFHILNYGVHLSCEG